MTCAEVQNLFSEYHDGSEDERVRAHLASCEPCRREYEAYRSSLELLAAHGRIEASDDLEDRILQAVLPRAERAELLQSTGLQREDRPGLSPPPGRVLPLRTAIAAAGLIVAAFLSGLAVRPTDDRTAQLEAKIRELEKRPPPTIVQQNVDEAAIAERIKKELNLKQLNGQYVSSEFFENVSKGNYFVEGRWITPQQYAELISRRAEPGTTEPAAPNLQKMLTDAGYVERAGIWMKRDDAERFDRGLFPLEPGKWVRMEDLQARWMEEHNLVREDGKVMTREQAEEMRGERTIRKPAALPIENPVTARLDGLKIGIPRTYGALSVYPIYGPSSESRNFDSLHAALAAGTAQISETSDTFELRITNTGPRPIFIPAGTLFLGGHFARVSRVDAVVEGQKVGVPVLCAQPRELSTSTRFSAESGHFIAPLSLRRQLHHPYGQSALWMSTQEHLQALGIQEKAPSINDLYLDDAVMALINQYLAAFSEFVERNRDAVGVAVAVNDRVLMVQIFGDSGTLASNFEQILCASVLEMHLQRKGLPSPAEVPSVLREVKRFIESAFYCEYRSTAEGYRLLEHGEDMGQACLFRNSVVSITLYPKQPERTPIEACLAATAQIPAKKMERVVKDYGVALAKVGPADRPRLIREVAALPSSGVTALLLRQAGEKDFEIRQSALQMLGERQDRAAVPDLVAMFRKSSKDRSLFPVLAQCLARIPDPRCTDALLRGLDEAAGDQVRQILEVLPLSILKIKDRPALEQAVQRLAAYYDQMYTAFASPPNVLLKQHYGDAALAAREALRKVTAQEFRDPSECSAWWNKNKDAWLSSMTEKK